MADYSILQGLRDLRSQLRKYETRVQVLVGEDNEDRQVTPPFVFFDLEGGNPDQPVDSKQPVDKKSDPKTFDADDVLVRAVVVGAGLVNPALSEEEKILAAYAASEDLLGKLRWVVKMRWPGISRCIGWRPLWPDGPQESLVPIEVQFAIRVLWQAPAVQTVVPLTREITAMAFEEAH